MRTRRQDSPAPHGRRLGERAGERASMPGEVLTAAAAARATPVALQRAGVLAAQRMVGNQAASGLFAPAEGERGDRADHQVARDVVTTGTGVQSFGLRIEIPYGDGASEERTRSAPAPVVSPDSATGNGPTVEVTQDEPGSVTLSVSDAI